MMFVSCSITNETLELKADVYFLSKSGSQNFLVDKKGPNEIDPLSYAWNYALLMLHPFSNVTLLSLNSMIKSLSSGMSVVYWPEMLI